MHLHRLVAAGLLVPGCVALERPAPAPATAPTRHGLHVRDGVVTRDGKPFRGIGANYFGLFYRTLKDPADTRTLEGLARLAEAGVPFVRFMCSGFWPVDWRLYREDREEYFRRLDRVVRAAEECGIGLVPSLFWHAPTVPDLVGEPMDQLGNPGSETIGFMRAYTEEVVSRYRNSPAVWGWEMGNEYGLSVDLPNHGEHRPAVWPALGTPARRTERDELRSEHLRVACRAFAETVRRLDPGRIVITGNSMPRDSAFHNTLERTWTRDSPEEFRSVLLRDNPDPFDVISVHAYHDGKGRYAGPAESVDGTIAAASRVARGAGKPLFVGEFGARRRPDRAREEAEFREILAAVESHDVPLAAFWVFDHAGQDETWNVTFENDRRYMIDLVSRANARLRKRPAEAGAP